jgi:hypothetical protein
MLYTTRPFVVDATTFNPNSHNHQLILPPTKNRHRRRRQGFFLTYPHVAFSWTASLNETTGIASSKETSSLNLKYSSNNGIRDSDLAHLTEQMFSSYLSWLVRPAITFGALRQGSVVDENGADDETAIQLRCLKGVNLLSFGRPHSLRTFQHQRFVSVTTNLPITGGWFAVIVPADCRLHRFPFQKKVASGGGALRLSLLCKRQKTSYNKRTTLDHDDIQIQTELVGYRPRLASGHPVRTLRKHLYLSTQSIIHAYVMWRFHRHIVHSLLDYYYPLERGVR